MRRRVKKKMKLTNLPRNISEAFKSNDVHGAYDYLIDNMHELHLEILDFLANIEGDELRESVRQKLILKLVNRLGNHELTASSYGHMRSHDVEAEYIAHSIFYPDVVIPLQYRLAIIVMSQYRKEDFRARVLTEEEWKAIQDDLRNRLHFDTNIIADDSDSSEYSSE